MTATLHEIETSESDDGSTHPIESLWVPGEDAVENGFIVHRGLYVTGIDYSAEDHLYPVALLLLGHQKWADTIEAAAAYMAHVHSWRNLHLYPGDDPSELIPRIPRAVHTHGVFLRHSHPEQACGYECEDTWTMVWVSATEPGAVPITAMRHPAAKSTAAVIPSPDDGSVPATWAA